jgi:hypothetical protein
MTEDFAGVSRRGKVLHAQMVVEVFQNHSLNYKTAGRDLSGRDSVSNFYCRIIFFLLVVCNHLSLQTTFGIRIDLHHI